MNVPGSSTAPLALIDNNLSFEKCQICDQKAHGNHFGAVTCRACAAFFRRVGASKFVKPCKKSNKCTYLKSGWFNCKKCRLEKCRKMGMTVDNFQYFREASLVANSFKIPNTINTLLGESNLIIFSTGTKTNQKPKTFIDLNLLLKKTRDILEKGSEAPLFLKNSQVLDKLAIGLQNIRGDMTDPPKSIDKLGRDEILAVWQKDLLKVAEWLTYFDCFQQLPVTLRLTLLKTMWHAWCRLEHVAHTALARRQEHCEHNQIMIIFGNERYFGDLNTLDVDLSWCSEYKMEQLRFFFPNDHTKFESLIDMVLELEPSDQELSYLMCQICFHYAKKKHDDEITQVIEKFQEVIENDLHNYYIKEKRMPRYCGRLAKLMKINNKLHEIFNQERVRKELADLFGIFNIDCSHPEMFK